MLLFRKRTAYSIGSIIQCGGIAQSGRASDWQSEGQGFEPPYLHHSKGLRAILQALVATCSEEKVKELLTAMKPLHLERLAALLQWYSSLQRLPVR